MKKIYRIIELIILIIIIFTVIFDLKVGSYMLLAILLLLQIVFIIKKEDNQIKNVEIIDYQTLKKNFLKYSFENISLIIIRIQQYEDYIQKFGKESYKNYYNYLISFLSETLRADDMIVSIPDKSAILIIFRNIPLSVFPERAQFFLNKLKGKTVFKYKFFLKTINSPTFENISELLQQTHQLIESDSELIII